jgi:hypothetical protein
MRVSRLVRRAPEPQVRYVVLRTGHDEHDTVLGITRPTRPLIGDSYHYWLGHERVYVTGLSRFFCRTQ